MNKYFGKNPLTFVPFFSVVLNMLKELLTLVTAIVVISFNI